MKTIAKNTKTYAILNALQRGATVNEYSAYQYFDVGNLRAEVHRIRSAGYVVNCRKSNSEAVYELGKPTREMIALAYKAQRLGIKA